MNRLVRTVPSRWAQGLEVVRTTGVKVVRKGLRRLEIWIPDNHPVFDLPPKARSKWVRQVLDLAVLLEGRLGDLERRLAGIEERLASLSEKEPATTKPIAKSSGSANLQPMPASEPEEGRRPKIDVNEFLRAFE